MHSKPFILTAALLAAASAAGQSPSQPSSPIPPARPVATSSPSPLATSQPATPQSAATTVPAAKEATGSAPAPPAPAPLSGAASGTYDRRDSLPNVNVYLPEGQASIRLRKLIRNVLFESQIDYRFVNGDISTFLRYKYYARNFTYKIGVFDSIGFPDFGKASKTEFERTRGGLLLVEFPRDYNNRYFWQLEDDRLTFGDLTKVDNRKNNIYTKLGYQFGTQFDERLNAIVGETRGRITPVLTAFRDIGPQKTGFAVALTEAARISTGDYKYTKLETEVLRRWDITGTSFVITRAHAGTFLTRERFRDTTLSPVERFSIPRYEMFRLGGREALKSVPDRADFSEGTQETHATAEYFVPVFRNRDYRMRLLHLNTMYGIGYLGAGTVAFDYRDLAKRDNRAFDVGIGTEMSLTFRDYEILLSVIASKTVQSPDGLNGKKVRFSVRTTR